MVWGMSVQTGARLQLPGVKTPGVICGPSGTYGMYSAQAPVQACQHFDHMESVLFLTLASLLNRFVGFLRLLADVV